MGYSRGRCVQSYDDDGVNEKDLLGLKAAKERALTVSVASLLCECRCRYVARAARLLSP